MFFYRLFCPIILFFSFTFASLTGRENRKQKEVAKCYNLDWKIIPYGSNVVSSFLRDCPICQNDSWDITTPCKHTFHWECLMPWLVKNCTCPICRTDFDSTFFLAISSQDEELLKSLMAFKIYYFLKEMPLLHLCTELGFCEGVDILINEGFDPNESHLKYGIFPLHCAVIRCNYSTIVTLLKNGANINALSAFGHSALYLALKAKDCRSVQILLENGADIASHCSEHYPSADSPLQLAIHESTPEILSLVRQHSSFLHYIWTYLDFYYSKRGRRKLDWSSLAGLTVCTYVFIFILFGFIECLKAYVADPVFSFLIAC